MPNYRRYRVPGGCYFFTVNLRVRHHNDILVRYIDPLRDAVRRVYTTRPFHIDGWVVLPEHLHCIWTLPPGDTDFSTRWRLIKSFFATALPGVGSDESLAPGERGIWQRRFWEHAIRDDTDYAAHLDYLHFNPVKHGHVARVVDWPFSSFHRYVERGAYPSDWGGDGVAPANVGRAD